MENLFTKLQCFKLIDAHGALIRAGAKWLDFRSCPAIADVITLASIVLESFVSQQKFLRNVSSISGGVVALHIALFALYYSVGQILFIPMRSSYAPVGNFLTVTGIISLAIFCLSTQFSRYEE